MNRDLFAASGVGGGVVEATTDPYFKSTTLLLSGDGTNGAQNNTFIDSSANNATITRAGTPTQGSFSPFSQTGWSGYFNGTTDSLSIPSSASLVPQTLFTFECWLYPTVVQGTTTGIFVANTTNGIQLAYYGSSGLGLATKGNAWQFNGIVLPIVGQWNHVALCRGGTGTNQCSIFLNGVRVANGTAAASFVQSAYEISSTQAGGSLFQGYISNARFVNGVDVYGYSNTTYTPPSAPLTAITNTSLLTLQDNRFKDNAVTPNTITVTGTPSIQAFSPFAPTAAYSVPAAAAGSAYFNGSSYISVPDSTAFTMGSGDFTLEAWVYLTSAAQQVFIGTYDSAGSASSPSFTLGLSSTGVPRVGVGYAGVIYYATAAASIITNTWVHVAGVRSGASVYVYVNGVQSTALNMAALAITDSTQIVAIGRNGAYNGEYVTGYISNLRIVKGTAVYTAAFTPPSAPLTAVTGTSLLTLQDSTFKDNATPPNPITASSPAPVIQSFTPFTQVWGGSFNGSSDYLTIPSSAGFQFPTGTDFTVECWVYFNSVSGSGSQIILSPYLSSGWELYWQGTTKKFTWYANTSAIIPGTMVPVANTWYHVAISRQNGVTKSFVNGILDYSVADTANYAQTSPLYIGLENGSAGYFGGYISNVRIVKGTAVYTTTSTSVGAVVFTPPAKTLSATQVAGTNIAPLLGSETSLLTLQDPTFKDNATVTNTITAVNTAKTRLVSAPFTGSAEGSAWNISVTAPLATVGGSMYFDGSSYLSVSPTSNFAFGTGDFTFECWIYGNSTTFASGAIFSPNVWNGGSLYWAILANGGNVTWQSSHGNTNLFSISAVAYYNTWLHITVVRSSGTTKMYFNGVQVASAADSNNYVLTTTYVIARNGDGPYNMGAGYLSNLRIVKGTAVYTGNFTPPTAPPLPTQTAGLLGTNVNAIDGTNTSLLLLGTNAGIYDATAKNDIITVGNAQVSSTQIKYGTGAMYFDGTGDYLAMPASINWMFGTGDFTVEFWINTAGTNSQILSLVGGTAAGNWQVSLYGGSIYWQSARNTTDTYVVSSSAISNSAWHHVAYCRTSNALKVYFDGVAQGAGINDTTNYNISSVLNVGYSSSYFTGYLDDLRITKYARYPGSAFPTKAMIGQ